MINTDHHNQLVTKYFSKKLVEYNSFAYTTIIEHVKCKNDEINFVKND